MIHFENKIEDLAIFMNECYICKLVNVSGIPLRWERFFYTNNYQKQTQEAVYDRISDSTFYKKLSKYGK